MLRLFLFSPGGFFFFGGGGVVVGGGGREPFWGSSADNTTDDKMLPFWSWKIVNKADTDTDSQHSKRKDPNIHTQNQWNAIAWSSCLGNSYVKQAKFLSLYTTVCHLLAWLTESVLKMCKLLCTGPLNKPLFDSLIAWQREKGSDTVLVSTVQTKLC